tara:strand:- start:6587 stop:10114 length:3528 start_codon:yes stop_codon:yes gene_type:complete
VADENILQLNSVQYNKDIKRFVDRVSRNKPVLRRQYKDLFEKYSQYDKVVSVYTSLITGEQDIDTSTEVSPRDLLSKAETIASSISNDENLKKSFIEWFKRSNPAPGMTEEQAGIVYTAYSKENSQYVSKWYFGGDDYDTATAASTGTLMKIPEGSPLWLLRWKEVPIDIIIAGSGLHYPPDDASTLEMVIPFWDAKAPGNATANGNRLIQEFTTERGIQDDLDALDNVPEDQLPYEDAEANAEFLQQQKAALYAQAATGAQGLNEYVANIPKDKIEKKVQWWATHKQCILLSGLEKLSQGVSVPARQALIDSGIQPYQGKLFPVKAGKAERFINELTLSDKINNYLGPDWPADWFTFVLPKVRLSLIKAEGAGLREWDFTSINDDSNVSSLGCDITADRLAQNAAILGEEGAGQHVIFESFTYTMNGSDPSTSRKDISATLKIKLTSLEWLNTGILVDSLGPDGEMSKKEFKVVDLLLYPSSRKNARGYGQAFKNQYDPSYNRLRAVIFNELDKPKAKMVMSEEELSDHEKMFNDTTMVLDLALVDHELSIDKSKDEISVSLSIEYAGYFETTFSAPYMDGLASPEIIKERKRRQSKLDEAVDLECTISQLNAIQRNLQRAVRAEAILARRSIMERLIERKKIYKINFNIANIASYLLSSDEVPDDIERVWQEAEVELSSVGSDTDITSPTDDSGTDIEASTSPAGKVEEIQKATQRGQAGEDAIEEIYYFFLGDLIEIISDVMYAHTETVKFGKGVPMADEISMLNARFITSTFNYRKLVTDYSPSTSAAEDDDGALGTGTAAESGEEAEPDGDTPASPKKTGGGKTVGEELHEINIADIPISVDYFKAWFKQTVIDKERTYYPVMTMVRDLAEVVITNMLNEVCFGARGAGAKLKFRVSHHSSAERVIERAYTGQRKATLSFNGLSKPVLVKNPFAHAMDYWNYIVLYCHEHNIYDPEFGRDSYDVGGKIDYHYKEFIPHLLVGENVDGAVISANFSKTDTPFLKEARYFDSSGGSLIQLANVYDVGGMKLHHNTFCYPGQMTWIEFQELLYCGGGPSTRGSIANQLGLGGYHLMKKVTGTLYPNNKGETTVDATWAYSGADPVRRKTGDATSISANPKCDENIEVTDQEATELELEASNQQTQDYPTGVPESAGGGGVPDITSAPDVTGGP